MQLTMSVKEKVRWPIIFIAYHNTRNQAFPQKTLKYTLGRKRNFLARKKILGKSTTYLRQQTLRRNITFVSTKCALTNRQFGFISKRSWSGSVQGLARCCILIRHSYSYTIMKLQIMDDSSFFVPLFASQVINILPF